MNTRHIGIFGLAALGLALAAPVHAAPNFVDGLIVVAKRDREEVRDARRDDRKEDRRAQRQNAERDDAQGYGYGYERRQQQRTEEDDRNRGRR